MRFLLLLLIAGSAHAQSTLDAVRARGFVQCGVNTGVAGHWRVVLAPAAPIVGAIVSTKAPSVSQAVVVLSRLVIATCK